MVRFTWNNALFDITDIGGGTLGTDIPRHAHSKNSYELHFITGGIGKLITDTKQYNLKKGDFFITGPNIYHEQIADKDNPVQDVFIMLQAVNTNKANAISLALLETHFYYYESYDFTAAQEILKEYKNKKTDYVSAISGLTMKLLTDITRLIIPGDFNESIISKGLNDRRFVIIEQAFLYTPDLTLTELSNRIGLCERQTQRLLKKYYGKGFREKKKEQTVNNSKNRLYI